MSSSGSQQSAFALACSVPAVKFHLMIVGAECESPPLNPCGCHCRYRVAFTKKVLQWLVVQEDQELTAQ